ncbi:Ground-like domain-containing protein [Caenorhabditis elegans]|uniref:Ground-like domain-containing protein n=1 Tax=Caenorhabditis elegans TaxID=6239 RepID=Q22969_CAEEL|nr:Ground-like domain-containing protein [Caenorhabditis elegans]CCD70113.1 Ground-like domain-containing protein [Caenorhabditis elegans]|eukprot:NP_505229.2 GRound-Like (grd related) [Caenorhabditis elegans]
MLSPFLLLFLLFSAPASAFFNSLFGGSNCGCSCTPPPSTCPTTCLPIMTCTPPSPPACCNTCGTCNGKRRRRHLTMLSNATYVADHEKVNRVKRQDDQETTVTSGNCNSVELQRIIESKIDRVTAIAKRRIQEEAEATMGGRFNVICARGDFSYVANTELFCQHSVGDVTCFLFKQLSDVVRRRLM